MKKRDEWKQVKTSDNFARNIPIVCPVSSTEILIAGGVNKWTNVSILSDYFIYDVKRGSVRKAGDLPFNLESFGF